MVSSRKKIRKINMNNMLSGCEEKMKRNKIKKYEKLKRKLIQCYGFGKRCRRGREIKKLEKRKRI